MTSPRIYDALGAFMAASATADANHAAFVTQTFDAVNFPREYRWIFPPIKAAAAVGVAFHVKARDVDPSGVSAAALAVIFGVVAAKGPEVSR
jgi:hypothetical protein